MQLARQKLGKKNTPPTWRPPLPYGRHGALLPAPPHTTISQHDAQQVYFIKTRGYYCFYYLLALLRHDASLTHRVYVCLLRWLPVAYFGQEKGTVTHLCTFDHRLRMAEPERTEIGGCDRWRRKPCWGCFLRVFEGDLL